MNYYRHKHQVAGQSTGVIITSSRGRKTAENGTVLWPSVLFLSIALSAGCSAQKGNVGVFDHDRFEGDAAFNEGTNTTNEGTNTTALGSGESTSAVTGESTTAGTGGSTAAGTGGSSEPTDSGGREALPEQCDGPIVSQVFRYAICSCNDISVLQLTTDAFDSAQGQSGLTGAAVGVNGSLMPQAFNPGNDIGGSLTVTGEQGMSSLGVLEDRIRGDLRVQGPLSYSTRTHVSRSAWVGSDIIEIPPSLPSPIAPDLYIAGDLILPDTAAIPSSVTVFRTTERQPVTIQPPCACGDREMVDIPQIIADGKANNDNLLANFDADSLNNITGTQRVELPARAYVTSIGTNVFDVNASITLVINQKTSLFVEGDVGSATSGAAGAPLQTEIGPNGSLDMFVGGNFGTISATMKFGDPKRASKVRVYVAGGQGIMLVGAGTFGASLYAPRADVIMAGPQDYYGALFVGNLFAPALVNVHYDNAIIREEEDCTPTDECHECSDCGATSACVDGKCGPCREDSDCCEPLVCDDDGVCGPIIII